MATSSEVKSGLDSVSKDIAKNRARLEDCIATAAEVSALLAAIPTTYSEVAAEINAYTPNGAFESLSKDELARLTSEFNALKANADTIAAVILD